MYVQVDLVQGQKRLRCSGEDVSRRLAGGGDIGVGGRDGPDSGIAAELARRNIKADGREQLRGESVEVERGQTPGLGGQHFVFGAVDVEGDDLQVAIVGHRRADGLIDGQQIRAGALLLRQHPGRAGAQQAGREQEGAPN